MQEMKYLSFSDAKGDFIRIGIELATNAQRDTFAENPMKVRFEIGTYSKTIWHSIQLSKMENSQAPNFIGVWTLLAEQSLSFSILLSVSYWTEWVAEELY